MAGKRQKELEGFEHPNSIPELDAASERAKAASKKRKHAQDAESEAQDLLDQLMERHKLLVYENHDFNPPLIVTVSTKRKVKVEELEPANETPVEAHRKVGKGNDEDDGEASTSNLSKLEQKASKKSTPDAAA